MTGVADGRASPVSRVSRRTTQSRTHDATRRQTTLAHDHERYGKVRHTSHTTILSHLGIKKGTGIPRERKAVARATNYSPVTSPTRHGRRRKQDTPLVSHKQSTHQKASTRTQARVIRDHLLLCLLVLIHRRLHQRPTPCQLTETPRLHSEKTHSHTHHDTHMNT